MIWAAQQQELLRDKRDIFYYDYEVEGDEDDTAAGEPDAASNYRPPMVIGMDSNEINYVAALKLNAMESEGLHREPTLNHNRMEELNRPHRPPLFNDELWDHEWYLVGFLFLIDFFNNS